MKIHRINPCKRWSDVTVFNGIATFTEVTDTDTSADIKGQVEQIFNQAEASLSLVDSDKSRILAVTIYVTDFANMDVLNDVWDSWFPQDCAPSRACVKVELIDPDLLIKITFTITTNKKYQS